MANYVLKTGANLLKSGNYILTSSDSVPAPTFDINPETWGTTHNTSVASFPAGGGLSFNQTDPAKQAIYLSNQINGKPALKFDGVNDTYLALTSVLAKTIFLVVKSNDIVRNQATLFSGTYGVGGYFMGGESNEWFNSAYSTVFGQPSLKNRLWVNGYQATQISGATRQNQYVLLTLDVVDPAATDITYLGSVNGGAAFLNFELARMVVYSGRLTELQRVAKQNELLTYYNL